MEGRDIMKKILLIMFIMVVGIVAYGLMSGAIEMNLSIQLQYDNLHKAVEMASK